MAEQTLANERETVDTPLHTRTHIEQDWHDAMMARQVGGCVVSALIDAEQAADGLEAVTRLLRAHELARSGGLAPLLNDRDAMGLHVAAMSLATAISQRLGDLRETQAKLRGNA